jgi:hypothetical protein
MNSRDHQGNGPALQRDAPNRLGSSNPAWMCIALYTFAEYLYS